jgi:hypothetical protein
VCSRLSIAPDKWVFFKDVVKDCIRVRRANSNAGIKHEYLGKPSMHVMTYTATYDNSHTRSKAALKENDDTVPLPGMRNMLAMRKLGNNTVNEAYLYFCEKFLKYVVGVQSFNRAWKKNVPISEMATPTDEALALLLLENSHLRWSAEFAKAERGEVIAKEDKTLPMPLYTRLNGSQGGFTRKYCGWSENGIARFNELYEMVKKDRLNNGRWFDNILAARLAKSMVDKEDEEMHVMSVKADNDLFGGGTAEENETRIEMRMTSERVDIHDV